MTKCKHMRFKWSGIGDIFTCQDCGKVSVHTGITPEKTHVALRRNGASKSPAGDLSEED